MIASHSLLLRRDLSAYPKVQFGLFVHVEVAQTRLGLLVLRLELLEIALNLASDLLNLEGKVRR